MLFEGNTIKLLAVEKLPVGEAVTRIVLSEITLSRTALACCSLLIAGVTTTPSAFFTKDWAETEVEDNEAQKNINSVKHRKDTDSNEDFIVETINRWTRRNCEWTNVSKLVTQTMVKTN